MKYFLKILVKMINQITIFQVLVYSHETFNCLKPGKLERSNKFISSTSDFNAFYLIQQRLHDGFKLSSSHSYRSHFLWKLLILGLVFRCWFPFHCFILRFACWLTPLCWHFVHPFPVFSPECSLLHSLVHIYQFHPFCLSGFHILSFVWEDR